MRSLLRNLSMGSRLLRPQLVVAFALMSVLPILLLLSFVFPSLLTSEARPVVLVLVVLFAVSGFLLMKKVIDSVIVISQGVRSLASGQVTTEISCPRQDELGDLGKSLNQLAGHIKSNMDELKIYGERTRTINTQINRQLLALGGLLEISNLITGGADLREVFEAAVTKVALFTNVRFAFLMMKEAGAYKVSGQYGLKENIAASLSLASNVPILDRLLSAPRVLRSRGGVAQDPDANFLKFLDAVSLLTCPVVVCAQAKGFVAIGNGEETEAFSEEDVELIGVFAKQVSLAVENNFLASRLKEAEIRDSVSGLYNKRYLVQRLDEEILRAISNQRPCAFIVLQVAGDGSSAGGAGTGAAADRVRAIAAALQDGVRCFDSLGRLEDDVYGIIVPEKNKRQAEEFAKQILEKVSAAMDAYGPAGAPAFRVAVAENPIDGADAAGLLRKVQETIAVKA
jgi:GGDEF domain-containing protein/HAMP domain-containing protein